jgi:NDP-sugar pyrophosphorylase family protein
MIFSLTFNFLMLYSAPCELNSQLEVYVNFVPVILAGGSGERFWSLSRRAKPKQFLALNGGNTSLLQASLDHLKAFKCYDPSLLEIFKSVKGCCALESFFKTICKESLQLTPKFERYIG